MWREIYLSELDNYCIEAKQAYQAYDLNTYELLEFLYAYGFRINEIYEISRRTILNEKLVKIQLSKREGTREINNDPIDFDLWNNWLARKDWFPYSMNSYEYRLKRVLPRIRANEDEVRRVSHIFRYRYIWFLRDTGMSVEQVQQIIGHKNLSSTMKYYYGSLFVWDETQFA